MAVTACEDTKSSSGAASARSWPAAFDEVTLEPLPDKKLRLKFRVVDAQGKPVRAFNFGYTVLGCNGSRPLRDSDFDAANRELATSEIDLEHCGSPGTNKQITVKLNVDGEGGKIAAVKTEKTVDVTASYTRSKPRSIEELDSQLGQLGSLGLDTTRSPFEVENPIAGPFYGVVERIVEIGPPAIPRLLEIWKQPDTTPIQARAAAAAIGTLDPQLLVKEGLAFLDAYDRAYVAANTATEAPEELQRKVVAAGSPAAAAVHAAPWTKRDLVVDVYFRSLSSPDSTLSKVAAAWIKKQLKHDEAVAALFRYMAAKQKYAQSEIDVYVDVITSFGADASSEVVSNLDALLKAAGGKPDAVFWAHKVVGLTALQKIGTASAVPTIEAYKTDRGTFVSVVQELDPDGTAKPPKQTTIAFRTLADRAHAEASKR